eukprot:900301-Alexandrium_andersonii.AAC.1
MCIRDRPCAGRTPGASIRRTPTPGAPPPHACGARNGGGPPRASPAGRRTGSRGTAELLGWA